MRKSTVEPGNGKGYRPVSPDEVAEKVRGIVGKKPVVEMFQLREGGWKESDGVDFANLGETPEYFMPRPRPSTRKVEVEVKKGFAWESMVFSRGG